MNSQAANGDLFPDAQPAAARLCAACGMCCDGSLFQAVYLQPKDSPKAVAALGLKLKFKKKKYFFGQPCAAFKNGCCSVYEERPERCRAFECPQLRRVASGVSGEEEALEKIREARAQIANVERLLARAGETRRNRPLAKRCEKVLEQPVSAEAEPELAATREQLAAAMRTLEDFFEAYFRV